MTSKRAQRKLFAEALKKAFDEYNSFKWPPQFKEALKEIDLATAGMDDVENTMYIAIGVRAVQLCVPKPKEPSK